VLFPEFLYQLSARDQQVTWLDPVIARPETIDAAAFNVARFAVPDGRMLVVANVCLHSFTAGVTTISLMRLTLFPPAGAGVMDLAIRTPVAGLTADVLNLNGLEVLVPAQWIVEARTTFSAGAAGNTTRLNLAGILLPIANVQRI